MLTKFEEEHYEKCRNEYFRLLEEKKYKIKSLDGQQRLLCRLEAIENIAKEFGVKFLD